MRLLLIFRKADARHILRYIYDASPSTDAPGDAMSRYAHISRHAHSTQRARPASLPLHDERPSGALCVTTYIAHRHIAFRRFDDAR